MKKTLLFITASLDYDGAAKILCFVARSLSGRGYNVHVANLMTASDQIAQELPEDIKLHIAASGKAKGLRRLDQLLKVKRIAKSIGADVIIGFTFYPNIIASAVGKRLGVKSIISERGDPGRTIGGDILSKALLAVINQADGGVFQTDGAMRFYSRKMREKGKIIPNPIFLPAAGIPKREGSRIQKSVVSAGRLHNAQKRYDIMLKAFAIFSENHPDYTLRLIGDGPDEKDLRRLCKTLNLEDKVIFCGKSSQPMRDMVNDGMFLITSDYEGISNALLEAMAAGLPCVSTDHAPGGARLLISDHENGLLVPVGNAERIADAMGEFADDPSFAEACGNRAREVTVRFDPKRIIAEWDAYIMNL